MFDKAISIARVVSGWLAHQPGYMLLTASQDRLASQPPEHFRAAWLGVMAVSVAWGAGSTVLWSWTWGLFGDFSGIPLMPVVAVLAVGGLWLYLRSIIALAGALGGEGPGRSAAAAIIVVVWSLALVGLKSWNPDFPIYLPYILQWIRPRMMFRALLLAPIWGGWAMLIGCQFSRPTDHTEPAVAAFARGCGPLTATAVLAVMLPATILYFNHLAWTQLSISATAMVAAVGGGTLLCRRCGGLCLRGLLAANMLTQIAFLLAYLANR